MSQITKSTCCYCGVGCGVLIETDAGRITGVRGDPEHPANFGRLCTKGSSLHMSAREDYRLLQPMVRQSRGDMAVPTTGDGALNQAADKFERIIRAHGSRHVSILNSGESLGVLFLCSGTFDVSWRGKINIKHLSGGLPCLNTRQQHIRGE